jgi:GNAT superfamily N-acetyltransferase
LKKCSAADTGQATVPVTLFAGHTRASRSDFLYLYCGSFLQGNGLDTLQKHPSPSPSIHTTNTVETMVKFNTVPDLHIDRALESDVPLILSFIRKLAEYERLADTVVATEEGLREYLFGAKRYAEVLIARIKSQPVGFALFYYNFSTFVGKPGLYLEDLFVLPEFRGQGVGKALLVYLAKLTIDRNCGRFEWMVLDWNSSAIGFYKSLGAVPLTDWRLFRLSGDALSTLADRM